MSGQNPQYANVTGVMPEQDVYDLAGAASDAMHSGYDWQGEPQYAAPPSVLTEMAKVESGFDPRSVAADGKHFGLGNVGLPADSLEAGFYVATTHESLTKDDLFNPLTNLEVMALGLEKRASMQADPASPDVWYEAAASYAGFADSSGHFDPAASDPLTGYTGQRYFDDIKAGVAKDFPADAAGVSAGRTDATKDPDTSLSGQLKSLLNLGGVAGEVGKIALTVAFVIVGTALVIGLGMVTSKALSSGEKSVDTDGGHPVAKKAAEAALLL